MVVVVIRLSIIL